MSFLILICVVSVEALSLTLLWIALRVDMLRVLRPLVAGGGVSGAWGAWILGLVLHAPLAMTILTGVVFGVGAVAMGRAIHLATVEAEPGSEDGGSGEPIAVPELPSGGGDDDPVWWPEFQRELAEYAAELDRARVAVDG